MVQPWPLFVHFCSFNNNFKEKMVVDFSGTPTRIVRVEGKLTDHLTITTAHNKPSLALGTVGTINFANTLWNLPH